MQVLLQLLQQRSHRVFIVSDTSYQVRAIGRPVFRFNEGGYMSTQKLDSFSRTVSLNMFSKYVMNDVTKNI